MTLFTEVSVIIVIAAIAAMVMQRLRQPLIVGYIATGVIVGPFALNLLHAKNEMELLSTMGISILLFIVGLTLNPDVIRETGRASIITGVGQVVFTSVFGFVLLRILGFDPIASIYAAVALTFSSTIIILKLLSDRHETTSLYGRLSIGFLLVQDVIATLILLVVAAVSQLDIAQGETWVAAASAHVGVLALRGAVLAVVLYIVSKYILPRFARSVAHNQEVLFIFSIAWGMGLAALFHSVGFSVEIGALLAGALLAVSPFAQEIAARLTPLRDFFIVIFFILLGAHMALGELGTILVPAIILSMFVLIGNPLIVFVIMRILGYRARTAFMSGLTVAQISEFSLILVAAGAAAGHLTPMVVSLVTLVGVITITASTYMILFADVLYARLAPILRRFGSPAHAEREQEPLSYDVIIFGYEHDSAHALLSTLREQKRSVLVVDDDPDVIAQLTRRGVSCRYGDAQDVAFLEDIGCQHAMMILCTIPHRATAQTLLAYYRARNHRGIVIMTADTPKDKEALYAAGATYVVLPRHIAAHDIANIVRTCGNDRAAYTHLRTRSCHSARMV